MAKVEPRIPSGFMELLPEYQIPFNRMFQTIRETYELFGFTPIETPAIEFTEVLLAKKGNTAKQIWRVLKEDGSSDSALHFDLTVPLARYVAQRQEQLTFPFRRYQMQKVWRGERNQKNRFREFYQCDIDVIGTTNVLVDAEIPSIMFEAFKKLGFPNILIRINNRKILNGYIGHIGWSDKAKEVLEALDDLEKHGREKVIQALEVVGLSGKLVTEFMDFTDIKGSREEVIAKVRSFGIDNPLFEEGVNELETVTKAVEGFGLPRENFTLDISIVRGLDYYTGTVYEAILKDYPEVGSVCSGGRFDELAESYTDRKLPGVGMSIGLTRLFNKLKEGGIVVAERGTPSRVMVMKMGDQYLDEALKAATTFRQHGVSAEVYLEQHKIGKQFKYADRLKIPFVVIIGEAEVKSNLVTLKTMSTGEQKLLPLSEALEIISKV